MTVRSQHTRDEAETYHAPPTVPAPEHVAPERWACFNRYEVTQTEPDHDGGSESPQDGER